jgi:preprotein translocase SecE subunit
MGRRPTRIDRQPANEGCTMSLAVKHPETSSPGLLDRLRVGTLVGVVYVVAGLAIIFALLPWAWWQALGQPQQHTAVATTLLVLVGLGLAAGFVYGGLAGLRNYAVPGVKAGIFTALVTLLFVLLLTRWASLYFESWVYDSRSMSETVGLIATAAVGVVLLILAAKFIFLAPSFGPKMIGFEEQGWFSTTSFKRSQGVRVRRGTIVGILALVGCGIYAMLAHQALAGSTDWAINIPFTGKEQITDLNDTAFVILDDVKLAGQESQFRPFFKHDLDGLEKENREFLAQQLKQMFAGQEMKLAGFKDLNYRLKEKYLKLDEDVPDVEVGEKTLSGKKGEVISKDKYEELRKALKKESGPQAKAPEPATGIQKYTGLVLLPDVKYTLPFVLAAAAIWFAWRIVNVPSFADFLIATEAELNKVSWTTRRRLIQDTIVVLATVVLFTIFLFVVDVAWGQILSLKAVGVLKLPEKGAGIQKPEQKW